MATLPEADFFRNGQFCSSQSRQAPKFQGRNRERKNDHSEMKETEDLLASEFNKLSVQERSKALDDIHCVGDELQETPEMIERSLTEFDQSVQTTMNQIYTIAVNQNRSYVEDRSFRLKFLRANMFNVRKSVNQMMSFLRQKALYFGESKVAHDIVPGDLNGEVVALMRSGFIQILKDRDQSGRVIIYNSSTSTLDNYKIETLIHVLYHIFFNIVLSIPSVQTKGVVVICYDESNGKDNGEDNQKFPGFTFLAKVNSFAAELPIRASSLHICVHSSPGSLALHNKIARISLKAMSELAKTRTRLHYGSDMERQYQLRSFGIPLENFPIDENGKIRGKIHKAWCGAYVGNEASMVEQRSRNRIANTSSNSILETDVLFGRGRMVQYHAGNVRFRKFLDGHAEEYDRLPRHYRMAARIGYTQELLSSGTRFLRQNEKDLWVVCDFDEAAGKVSQFFRTRRRDKKHVETGS